MGRVAASLSPAVLIYLLNPPLHMQPGLDPQVYCFHTNDFSLASTPWWSWGGILVCRKLSPAEDMHGAQGGAHTKPSLLDVHGYCPITCGTLVSGVPLPPSWGCTEFFCQYF